MGINPSVTVTVLLALLGLANSYFLLRIALERSKMETFLAKFEVELLNKIENKFVSQDKWELVIQRLDANTEAQGEQIKGLRAEMVTTREHYHNLVNNLISQTTKAVTATLERKYEREREGV